MPRGKKNNRKRERDAVTETIGEHNLQYIMSFIEPEMRSFARITCSMWRHSIKGSVKFSKLSAFQQGELATRYGVSFLEYILENCAFNPHVYEQNNNPLGLIGEINLCWTAASNGNLELLKYLFENGHFLETPHMNSAVMAARKGHLDCLKFILENECDYNFERVYLEAELGGHIKCLEYLYKINGDEFDT